MAVVCLAPSSRPVVCLPRCSLGSVLAWVCVFSGCRFGGGDGEVRVDAALSDGGGGSTDSADDPLATRDAAAPSPSPSNAAGSSTPSPADTVVDAASAPGTVANNDASKPDRDAGSPRAPATSPNGAASPASDCGSAAAIPGCDPIRNTGCLAELGMQCDVDLAMTKPSGVCVFSAPPTDPNSCINIPPVETCPAGQSCIGGRQCQRICLCDSDCDAGECCSERIGNSGFKSCRPC